MKTSRIVAGTIALVAALVAPTALAPTQPAHAFPTIVVPTCAQIWKGSPLGFSTLFPAGTVLSSNTVRTGASNPRQAEIINGGQHINCTWTNSKRSITVSVAIIDSFEKAEIRAWYAANGIPLTPLGGGPANFAFVPHTAPRAEMQWTGPYFYASIDDRSFGSLGASMQSLYGTVYRLNPWMATIS
jgi:hypothetical protein